MLAMKPKCGSEQMETGKDTRMCPPWGPIAAKNAKGLAAGVRMAPDMSAVGPRWEPKWGTGGTRRHPRTPRKAPGDTQGPPKGQWPK